MSVTKTRSETVGLVVVAGIATAVLGLALALGWQPGIPREWVWRENVLATRLSLSIAVAIALILLAAALTRGDRWERMGRLGRGLSLGAIVLVVFALQVSLLNAVGVPWVSPGAYIVSPNVTTYFGISLSVEDYSEWLARYHELLPTLPHHAVTHPPGMVLFFGGVRRVCSSLVGDGGGYWAELASAYSELFGVGLSSADAAAAIASALAIAFIGSMGLIPLYFFAKRLCGAQGAIVATVLAASMPGLALLGASPDLIVMTLAVTALWVGCEAWQRRSVVLAGVMGLVTALGAFISLGFVTVAVWAAVAALFWTIGGRGERRERRVRAARLAAAAAGMLAAGCVVLYFTTGYRALAVMREALVAHRSVTTVEFARTYWKWVLVNPVECAIFAGVPAVTAALWSWRVLKKLEMLRLKMFVLGWLTVLALLNLSGVVRGEVGRIWLFLMWPVALAASPWFAVRAERLRATPILVLLQVGQTLLMKGYLTIYSIL